MSRLPAPDRSVAQGNHIDGYQGVIIRDWDGPTEHVVARCKHRHPTTTEARSCAGSAWFQAHDVHNITVVP